MAPRIPNSPIALDRYPQRARVHPRRQRCARATVRPPVRSRSRLDHQPPHSQMSLLFTWARSSRGSQTYRHRGLALASLSSRLIRGSRGDGWHRRCRRPTMILGACLLPGVHAIKAISPQMGGTTQVTWSAPVRLVSGIRPSQSSKRLTIYIAYAGPMGADARARSTSTGKRGHRPRVYVVLANLVVLLAVALSPPTQGTSKHVAMVCGQLPFARQLPMCSNWRAFHGKLCDRIW